MAIVFTILAASVVVFATNKVAVEIVAISVALSLAATGVLDVDRALAGFGDRTVIFVTVSQEHDVRTSLRERLEALPYEIWLNLELTPADPTDATTTTPTSPPSTSNPKDER